MMTMTNDPSKMTLEWQSDSRWSDVVRPYLAQDVVRLQGSIQIEHTLARLGAERLWNLLHSESYVPALGAMTQTYASLGFSAGAGESGGGCERSGPDVSRPESLPVGFGSETCGAAQPGAGSCGPDRPRAGKETDSLVCSAGRRRRYRIRRNPEFVRTHESND